MMALSLAALNASLALAALALPRIDLKIMTGRGGYQEEDNLLYTPWRIAVQRNNEKAR